MSAKSSITSRRRPPGNRGAEAADERAPGLLGARLEDAMALPHAHLLDVIDIRPLGAALVGFMINANRLAKASFEAKYGRKK